MSYARECLTWDAKAQRTTRVLNWAVRRGPKPDFRPQRCSAIQIVKCLFGSSRKRHASFSVEPPKFSMNASRPAECYAPVQSGGSPTARRLDMRIIVTGGAGFIGSHFVDLVVGLGGQVVVVDDLSSGRADNLPTHRSVEFVKKNFRNCEARDFAGSFDALVHLAALPSVASIVGAADASA